eukprot:TRINITY_DN148_c3_g2_i1.p2 TRINITY_DN148_c3_g2~~TRINITY_DN148_c3_g2_i1.p2  ORF type:complete len:100 (-),score=22.41 TRINITY_DN148_c3_g2_i1:156-431(-)
MAPVANGTLEQWQQQGSYENGYSGPQVGGDWSAHSFAAQQAFAQPYAAGWQQHAQQQAQHMPKDNSQSHQHSPPPNGYRCTRSRSASRRVR